MMQCVTISTADLQDVFAIFLDGGQTEKILNEVNFFLPCDGILHGGQCRIFVLVRLDLIVLFNDLVVAYALFHKFKPV
jgi:hypothetical protein